ncbi:MAG: hypothetical protein IAF00_03630 [Phycisphaerales bacterium]|nr:hypothetical protein [Phycisphaerales bacterium]
MRRYLLFLLGIAVLLPSYALVLLIRLFKWLIAPAALLLQLLLRTPQALWRVRLPLRPHLSPIQETELPDAAWLLFTDTTASLTAAGFVHCADFRNEDLIPGVRLWLRLLAQPQQGSTALIAHIQFTAKPHRPHHFVEFSTQLQDGRMLITNNLNMPYSLPTPAYMARLQLKDVWDPRALYALHGTLLTALAQAVDLQSVAQALDDPADRLIDYYNHEIQALIASGWLKKDRNAPDVVRLRPWAALVGVWRQSWPLRSLYLRAADRHACRLLARHGIDACAFMGNAAAIQVECQPLPEGITITTARAGYDQVQPLAQRSAPHAVLEAVVVELDGGPEGTTKIRELRYSFRGCEDQAQRRLRRQYSFDILIDLTAHQLVLTAMERECEQATDPAEWDDLTATPSLTPLVLETWPHDLDHVLPTAKAALATQTAAFTLDSASLYVNGHGVTCWQVVAWNQQDQPLYVMVDARSGLIKDE